MISASSWRRWWAVNDPNARPLVVFDGACGFCTWCVEAAEKYVRAPVDYIPYQWADLSAVGVQESDAASSVQFVTRARVLSGARAVAAILQLGVAPWSVIGTAIDAPAVRSLAETGYRFVARHRGRLPGRPPAVDVVSREPR